MKRCERCRKEKPLCEYGPHSVDHGHPDGLRTVCESCWGYICWATS